MATREADLGVLFAAWWLHSAHGEDTYAREILVNWCGASGLRRMRTLAHQEDYKFNRGFWQIRQQGKR